jgi:hypothetical protein
MASRMAAQSVGRSFSIGSRGETLRTTEPLKRANPPREMALGTENLDGNLLDQKLRAFQNRCGARRLIGREKCFLYDARELP